MNITLLLTEQCNLNCSYCYCTTNSAKKMSFEVAKKIIDDSYRSLKTNTENLNILLFGGEPFLAFDLVQKIHSYVSEEKFKARCNLKTVTNGTILNDRIKTWLNKTNLQITLSFDGIGNDHNRFRDNSFYKIDLVFFQNLKTCTEINMTIIPDTLKNFAQNVIFLENKGFIVKTTLADGIDWSEEKNSKLLVQQLQVLMQHYYKNLTKVPCTLLSVSTNIVGGSEVDTCKAGTESLTFDTTGKFYSCHRCTDLYNAGDWAIPKEKLKLLNIGLLQEECENCIGKKICNTCPALIASMQDKIEAVKAKCKLQKIILYSNAIFHATLLTEYKQHTFIKRRNGQELNAMISGCKKIINELN